MQSSQSMSDEWLRKAVQEAGSTSEKFLTSRGYRGVTGILCFLCGHPGYFMTHILAAVHTAISFCGVQSPTLASPAFPPYNPV